MDEEQRLNMLLASYGLEGLLQENDIEEVYVLEVLVEKGLINMADYFNGGSGEEGGEGNYD